MEFGTIRSIYALVSSIHIPAIVSLYHNQLLGIINILSIVHYETQKGNIDESILSKNQPIEFFY